MIRGWAVAAVAGVLSWGLACQPDAPEAPAVSEPEPWPVDNATPPPSSGPLPSPEPAPSACQGLLPQEVPPRSLEILTGFVSSCEPHAPAMDGAGNLAYAAGYAGYGNVRWHVQAPAEGARYIDRFRSQPTPRLWPQVQGFQTINVICAGGSGIQFEAYDGTGKSLATVGLGNYNTCSEGVANGAPDPAGGTVIAWMPTASGEQTDAHRQLKVQRFNSLGQARFEAATVASWLDQPPAQHTVVVGTDVWGWTLVLWNGDAFFGAGSIAGRWLDEQGVPLTHTFRAQVPSIVGGVLSPLIGGGLALQADGKWTHLFPSGFSVAHAAPGWLARRSGRLEIVREGRAYALMPPDPSTPVCSQQVEVLAPDGTSCGKLTFETPAGECVTAPLSLGADGTILQQQLLSHPPEDGMNGCTQKWWPQILR